MKIKRTKSFMITELLLLVSVFSIPFVILLSENIVYPLINLIIIVGLALRYTTFQNSFEVIHDTK